MIQLTDLEATILDALLAGDAPELKVLRDQARDISVQRREHTGVGCYTHFAVRPGAMRLSVEGRLILSDVGAEVEGVEHGAGFVLYVERGVLDCLEVFTYTGEWPATPRLVSWYYLQPTDTGSGGLKQSQMRDLNHALSRGAG